MDKSDKSEYNKQYRLKHLKHIKKLIKLWNKKYPGYHMQWRKDNEDKQFQYMQKFLKANPNYFKQRYDELKKAKKED
jgi:hypothetical protein